MLQGGQQSRCALVIKRDSAVTGFQLTSVDLLSKALLWTGEAVKSWPPPPSTHHLNKATWEAQRLVALPGMGTSFRSMEASQGCHGGHGALLMGKSLDMKERRSQRWALTYGKEMWP